MNDELDDFIREEAERSPDFAVAYLKSEDRARAERAEQRVAELLETIQTLQAEIESLR